MPRKRPRNQQGGSAPRKKIDPNVRNTIILFADIMGASEVSNHNSPEFYFGFTLKFQQTFCDCCKDYLKPWYKDDLYYQFSARGDEGLLMIYPPAELELHRLGEHVDTAINIALALKRRSEERRVGKECRSRWSPDH